MTGGFWTNLFYSLFIELLVAIIAFFVKDNKRLQVQILAIGTILAGVAAFINPSTLLPSITPLPTSTTFPTQTFETPQINLEGTAWDITTSSRDSYTYVFEFLPNGTMKYTFSLGVFYDSTWKQDGNSVYLEISNKLSEWEGEINGDTITGHGRNDMGYKFTWTAKRRQ
ncbi:MAG: hypothetical protein U0X74_08710 [Anaerolineales bacterium]